MMERYLTEDELRRLLAETKRYTDWMARRDDAWIRMLLYSGLRLGEFSRVTVGDAQDAFRLGGLFVPKEHRKGYLSPDRESVTRRNRADDHVVRMHGPLREALAALLSIRRERGLTMDRAAPLVASRTGSVLTPRNYEQRFRTWAAAAELPARASPHWLRHTGGMRVVRTTAAGNPLLAVQRFLGHRSLASTGVYLSLTREEMDGTLAQAFGSPRRAPSPARRRQMWEADHAGA